MRDLALLLVGREGALHLVALDAKEPSSHRSYALVMLHSDHPVYAIDALNSEKPSDKSAAPDFPAG